MKPARPFSACPAMFRATVTCGQPCCCCQTRYGAASSTPRHPACRPPAPQRPARPDHGERDRSDDRDDPTCGFASKPIPTTRPAASSDGPLRRASARITNHRNAVVLSMSKVVVLVRWLVASAKPETAVHAAAISCARRAPPSSRATAPPAPSSFPRRSPTAAAAQQRARCEVVHQPAQKRHQRRLIRVAESRMRPGDDEVELVAVIAVPGARRDQHRRLKPSDHRHPARQRDPRPETQPLRQHATPSHGRMTLPHPEPRDTDQPAIAKRLYAPVRIVAAHTACPLRLAMSCAAPRRAEEVVATAPHDTRAATQAPPSPQPWAPTPTASRHNATASPEPLA